MKLCIKCQAVKPRSEFYKDSSKSDGIRPYCIPCEKARLSVWRKTNRKKLNKYMVDWKKGIKHVKTNNSFLTKQYILETKKNGCVICGYSKCLAALEFHHCQGDKEFAISKTTHSLEKIKSEIEKCICVCANCHREIHANMQPNLSLVINK